VTVVVGWAIGCGFAGEGAFDVVAPGIDSGPEATGPSTIEGGPAPDGAPMSDGSIDANADADAGGPPTTVTLATVGAVLAPTGNAQQTHLVYAVHSARWWLFAIDDADTKALRTYSSTDFVTWTAGTALVLPQTHGNQGANFTVAYADIGGADVVHIGSNHRVSNTDLRHAHTRAVISAGTIVFGLPEEIVKVADPGLFDPDGCSTVLTQDGHVMDLTGWSPYNDAALATGNATSFSSLNVELGTSWVAGFGTRQDIATETNIVNARLGLNMGGAEVLSLWEGAENEPNPNNVRFARWNGTTWGSDNTVFASNAQGYNDWSATRLSNGEVHAVRRTVAGAYQHRKLNAAGTSWSDGQTIAAMPGPTNGGVVLLSLGTRMLLATIGSDANKSVSVSIWNAGAWAAWTTVEGTAGTRSFLSGHASETPGVAALMWTEQVAAVTNVVGRRVLF